MTTRLLLVWLIVLIPAWLFAEPLPKVKPAPTWVGQQVIVKNTGSYMTVPGSANDLKMFVNIINPTVLSETKDSIEVHASGQNGFLLKSDVVRGVDGPAYFDKLLDENPKNYDVRVRRASLHRLNKQYDKALEDYNVAIEQNPSYALYQNRGTLYITTQEHELALNDFNTCIMQSPSFSAGLRSRALVYEQLNQLDDALADYQAAHEQGPDAIVTLGLGRVWAQKDNHDKAIEFFNRTVEINPKGQPAYCGRGMAYLEKNELAKAQQDFDKAISMVPSSAYGWQQRSSFHSKIGNYHRANFDSAEALRIDPDEASTLNTRAWFLATCPEEEYRQAKRAVRLARQACELSEWKNPNYIDTLSAALANNGEFAEAITMAEKALEKPKRLKNNGEETKKKLALFKQGLPYREEAKFKPKGELPK